MHNNGINIIESPETFTMIQLTLSPIAIERAVSRMDLSSILQVLTISFAVTSLTF